MREFSFLAVLLGILIGVLLAAANAFVGLKVGMTISASIPAAVMSLLILRTFLKRDSLLESNMVQTIGSAGESAAAGMIFTLPALFIMGHDPAYLEMIIWGGIGGLLGVCFMVPLRQILIVKEHGVLPFPEGVACAEVLESGESGGAGAKSVIWGAVVGGVYALLRMLGLWGEKGVVDIKAWRTQAELDSSPALLGVGYILGVRVAGYMLGGAILSWFILIPAIGFFGAGTAQPIFPATDKLIAQMSPKDIYDNYIRYIGAGAVAIGGLISLFKSLGTIGSSIWHVLAGIFTSRGARDRTEKDFPFPLLVLVIAGIGYAMWRFPQVRLDHIGVIAVLIFTFFFVTVSSRLVGIVGSSSNPVSGMTIATLLATALVYKFFVVGKAGGVVDLAGLQVTCLSVGAIVCVAISIAGDTSQDLKTGFLVKATPYKQQVGEMIGVLTSVVAIAAVILLLNKTNGFHESAIHPHPLPAPQANIMKILVEGVLGGNIPWVLIMIGGAAAVIVEMLGLPALPFAVGMYLPLGLSTPIMAGGLIRWFVSRKKKTKADHDPGVLTASGFVAGEGLMGVGLAGVAALITWYWQDPRWLNPVSGHEEAVIPAHLMPWIWQKMDILPLKWGLSDVWWMALPLWPFALLVVWLWWQARPRGPMAPPPSPQPPSGGTPPMTPGGQEAPAAPGFTAPPAPWAEREPAHAQEVSSVADDIEGSSSLRSPLVSDEGPSASPRFTALPSPAFSEEGTPADHHPATPESGSPASRFGPPEPVLPLESEEPTSAKEEPTNEEESPSAEEEGEGEETPEEERARTLRRLGPPRSDST